MIYDPPPNVVFISAAAAYIIGSVNFSILLFKLLKKGDPRDRFSRNAGATNVYRQAGPFWALVVLLLDMGRAVAVAWAALGWAPGPWVPWIGFAMILGNRYPLFHGLRGGKGVANYLGFSAYLSPITALVATSVWAVAWRLSGHPFIGSIAMVLILATQTVVVVSHESIAMAGVATTVCFILWGHRSNIAAALTHES